MHLRSLLGQELISILHITLQPDTACSFRDYYWHSAFKYVYACCLHLPKNVNSDPNYLSWFTAF